MGWTVHQGDYITPVCDVGYLLAQFSSIFRKPLVGTSAAAALLATKLMRSASLSSFVVHGKINRERSIGNVLAASGFEVFLPVPRWTAMVRPSQRMYSPLFPSYIFARFDICERLAFLKALGVISIIGRGKHPVPLTDDEVWNIRTMVDSGFSTYP